MCLVWFFSVLLGCTIGVPVPPKHVSNSTNSQSMTSDISASVFINDGDFKPNISSVNNTLGNSTWNLQSNSSNEENSSNFINDDFKHVPSVNSTVDNSTWNLQSNTSNEESRSNFMILLPMPPMLPMEELPLIGAAGISNGCILPTCLTANLVSSLQRGDEVAGGQTTDPNGIGKK